MFYAIQFAYSAPYENDPSKNRPERFLHFAVVNGRYPYADHQGWRSLGARVIGGKAGHLWRGPSIADYHEDHFIFRWTQSHAAYEASLHTWDDPKETLALLDALVGSLTRPDDL